MKEGNQMSTFVIKTFQPNSVFGTIHPKLYKTHARASQVSSKVIASGQANYVEVLELTELNNTFLASCYGNRMAKQWTFEFVAKAKESGWGNE